jgi:hypothetical protein
MQYYEEAINNNFYRLRPLVCVRRPMKKCEVILWQKLFGKKCRKHTDIQTPEMDDKIEKHRIVQRDVKRIKKCSEIQSVFYSKLYYS